MDETSIIISDSESDVLGADQSGRRFLTKRKLHDMRSVLLKKQKMAEDTVAKVKGVLEEVDQAEKEFIKKCAKIMKKATNNETITVPVQPIVETPSPLEQLYKNKLQCPICWDQKAGFEMIFSQDCSHCICNVCGPHQNKNTCPVCRCVQTSTYRVVLAHFGRYTITSEIISPERFHQDANDELEAEFDAEFDDELDAEFNAEINAQLEAAFNASMAAQRRNPRPRRGRRASEMPPN